MLSVSVTAIEYPSQSSLKIPASRYIREKKSSASEMLRYCASSNFSPSSLRGQNPSETKIFLELFTKKRIGLIITRPLCSLCICDDLFPSLFPSLHRGSSISFDNKIGTEDIPSNCKHGGSSEAQPQEARSRVGRSRSHRQAPQAPRRSRYGGWPAPPPHQLRQVPSGILRKGRYAPLLLEEERLRCQDRQGQRREAVGPSLRERLQVLLAEQGYFFLVCAWFFVCFSRTRDVYFFRESEAAADYSNIAFSARIFSFRSGSSWSNKIF